MEDDLLALESRRQSTPWSGSCPTSAAGRSNGRPATWAWGMMPPESAGYGRTRPSGTGRAPGPALLRGDRSPRRPHALRLARSDAFDAAPGAVPPDPHRPHGPGSRGVHRGQPGRSSSTRSAVWKSALCAAGPPGTISHVPHRGPERVVRVLVAYRASYADGWVDRLLKNLVGGVPSMKVSGLDHRFSRPHQKRGDASSPWSIPMRSGLPHKSPSARLSRRRSRGRERSSSFWRSWVLRIILLERRGTVTTLKPYQWDELYGAGGVRARHSRR